MSTDNRATVPDEPTVYYDGEYTHGVEAHALPDGSVSLTIDDTQLCSITIVDDRIVVRWE